MIREQSDVYKEALIVFSYCNDSFIEKIPDKVIQKLSDFAADSETEFYIDKTKNLSEQNISEECKDLISLVYYDYVAGKDEKNEIILRWTENEKIYQKELRENYSEIFKEKNRQNVSDINETEKNTSKSMIVKNKTVFSKIIELIKRIFNRN